MVKPKSGCICLIAFAIKGKTVVGDHCDRPTSGFNLRHRQIHSKTQVGGLRDSTLRLRLSVVSPILHFRCYISVPQVKNLGLAYRRSLRLRITKYVHHDYGLTRFFCILTHRPRNFNHNQPQHLHKTPTAALVCLDIFNINSFLFRKKISIFAPHTHNSRFIYIPFLYPISIP